MGRYDEALPLYRRALQIHEKALGPDHASTATSLNNLAYLLSGMGRYDEALPLYRRALQIHEKALGPDHASTATSLNNLAGLFESMGRYDEALPLYRRALQIDEKALGPDHPDTAIDYNNLAGLFRAMGRYDEALPLYRRALQIHEKALGPDHASTATSLNNLAGLFESMGRYDEALPLLRRALQVVMTSDITNSSANHGAIEHLSKFSANLAYFIVKHRPEPELDEAIFYYKLSVNTRQRMRAGTRGMDKAMRDSFTQQVADVYQELAKLLIQRGRLDEAERVLLMLKESDLTDYLRRNGSGPSAAGETLRWTAEEAKLHQDLQDIARSWVDHHAQWAEADKARKAGRIRDDGPEFVALDQKRQQLETQSDNLLQQASEKFQAQSRATAEKALASFTTARTALAQKLSDIAQLDGQPSPRTAGLLLLPGERGLTTVVTTERGATALMVPVDAKTLGTLVLDLRTALEGRGDYRQAAKALHAHLIAPAEQALGATQAAEIRQWAVLPYGVLRNLPFGVLMDGSDRHLIERYALVALTADGEGGFSNLDASPKSQWRSAGLGASIADSEFNNVALPGVRGELCGVVNDPGSAADCAKAAPRGVLTGRRYLDGQFTADQLNRLMGTPVGTSVPTLLHIATHFSIDKSLLLLGDGDKLKLSQLVNWNPRLGHYDLIALSACDSGKSTEGVESLGGLLRRQGAKSVLATLWPIADVGAGPLMVEFYRQRGAQRIMAKSEALRRAQLAMLRGELKNPDNSAVDLRHPYFWAGYVLMGNWL